MPPHRLDYGSLSIGWQGHDDDPTTAQVCAHCTCGEKLCGRGESFAEAYKRLHQAFARHLEDVDAGRAEPPGA